MRRALIAAVMVVSAPALAQLVTFPGVGGGSGGVVVSTTGPVNLTGTTAETNLASLRIPANSMGKNGVIELKCLWSYTNSANVKTHNYRWNNTPGGGVSITSSGPTTTATAQAFLIIRNTNATNVQVTYNTPLNPFGTSGGTPTTNLDTTQDTWLNITGQLALSTETLTLQRATATVFPAP